MEKSNNNHNAFNNERIDDSSIEEGEICNSPKINSEIQKSKNEKITTKNENDNNSECQSQITYSKNLSKCKNEEEIFNSFKNNISKINNLFNLQNSLEKKELEKKNLNLEKQNFTDIKIGIYQENKNNENDNLIDQSISKDEKKLNKYEDANHSYLKNSSLFTISIESEKDNNIKTKELNLKIIENEKHDLERSESEDGFKTTNLDKVEKKNQNDHHKMDLEYKDHEKYIKNGEKNFIHKNTNLYSLNQESENILSKKSNETKIQFSFLTENQIIENKDFLNKKNFVINESNENNDKYYNNNHIKIKILDDNAITDKEENYSSIILNNMEIDVENDISKENSREEENRDLDQENSNNLPTKPLEFDYHENKLLTNITESDNKKSSLNEEIVDKKVFKDTYDLEKLPQNLQKTITSFPILNNNNTNIVDAPIENKITNLIENDESDREKISDLLPSANLSNPNKNRNLNEFAEQEKYKQSKDNNDTLNKVDDQLKNNNSSNNTPKAFIHENKDKDKYFIENYVEKNLEIASNFEKEGMEQTAHIKKENLYSVKDKDYKKDKEKKNKKSIKEKKIGSKNCIYCKVEITDPSLFLKFKSSDDFLTYCKLYFEKLSQQKKEFYSKSISSFEKYYTEKYSNFEQTNNTIFKSIKTICKICYEENIKEENGFINILAALNYNIIINKKNPNSQLKRNHEYITDNDVKIDIPNHLYKVESKKNLTPTITSNKSKDLNISLEEIKNINKSENDIKFSAGLMQEIQCEKEFIEDDLLYEKSSMNNKNNVKNNEMDLEHSGKKKNSINSDMDSLLEKANLQNSFWNCSNKLELDSFKNINLLKNNLLGKKLNRVEQDLGSLKQKNSKNIINNKIKQNPSQFKEGKNYNNSSGNLLNGSLVSNVIKNNDMKTNNLVANQMNDNINKNPNWQFINKNKDNIKQNVNNEGSSLYKNTVNSKLNMNTKNISLENLNITNVFMNFDEKNCSKPILIDSNLTNNLSITKNNQNNVDNSNTLKNEEIILKNPNFEINRNTLKNLENLKKNYVDLNNFSIEKKLFLNSLQKKSELLIQNLSDLEKKKGDIQEKKNKIKNEELDTEKKVFALNNSKYMGKLMNTIDEQFENNKNTLYDSKLELKNPTNFPDINSNLDHTNVDYFNNSNQITQKKDINYLNNKIENSANINQNNQINLNNHSIIDDKGYFPNQYQNADHVVNETFTINQNPEADHIVNLIENHIELQNNLLSKNYNEKLNLSKGSSNKLNLIDRILNVKGLNNLISNNKTISDFNNSIITSEKNNTDLPDVKTIRNSSSNQKNSLEILKQKDAEEDEIHQKINTNITNNNENLSIQNNQQNQNNNSFTRSEVFGLQNKSNQNLNTNLQKTLLNQNHGLLISNTIPNNNPLNNLNSGFLINNSLFDAKKSNNDLGHFGTFNITQPNNINIQNNPFLNNSILPNLIQSPLSYGLPYFSSGNLSNMSTNLVPQQIHHLNSLTQLNPNLISTINPQTNLILGSNLLNSNPIDLNLLGLNNSLLQLPLPLSYNLPLQINSPIGIPLSLQNQIQLGNTNNMHKNNNATQKDFLNKTNNGEGNINNNLNNLQTIQQQINLLKGNINNNFNSIQGMNNLGVNITNQQLNLLKNINNLQQNLTIENYKGQDVANKTNQPNHIDINNLQNTQNAINNQIRSELDLKAQEFNRNITNQHLLSNLNNLNIQNIILQNKSNLMNNNSQDMLNNAKNQTINLMNSKMNSDEKES